MFLSLLYGAIPTIAANLPRFNFPSSGRHTNKLIALTFPKPFVTVDLNSASVEFSSLNRFNSAGVTSTLIFKDFANGLVKFTGGLSVADDGKVLGLDINTITISGVVIDGTSLTTGWSVVDGYLFNSQLSVPKPAEWRQSLELSLSVWQSIAKENKTNLNSYASSLDPLRSRDFFLRAN